MDRRTYLLTGAALTGLSGCTSGDSGGEQSGKQTNGDRDNGEPTVKDTPIPTPNIQQRLSYGEWHEADTYAFKVTGTEVFNSAYEATEKQQEIAFPNERQLVVADLVVKNISQTMQGAPMPIYWDFVADGRLKEKISEFDHPEYSEPVSIGWLNIRGDNRLSGLAMADEIEPGEKATYWFCTLTGPGTKGENYTVGYDVVSSGGAGMEWR